MYRNRERERKREREGKRKRETRGGERDCCCRCEQLVLLSEVFLLEDGGIAEGMKGAGLGFVSR